MPTAPTTVATIRNMKVGLRALMIVPSRQKHSDSMSMILRPYISESLPKISVTKALIKLGMEMAHE